MPKIGSLAHALTHFNLLKATRRVRQPTSALETQTQLAPRHHSRHRHLLRNLQSARFLTADRFLRALVCHHRLHFRCTFLEIPKRVQLRDSRAPCLEPHSRYLNFTDQAKKIGPRFCLFASIPSSIGFIFRHFLCVCVVPSILFLATHPFDARQLTISPLSYNSFSYSRALFLFPLRSFLTLVSRHPSPRPRRRPPPPPPRRWRWQRSSRGSLRGRVRSHRAPPPPIRRMRFAPARVHPPLPMPRAPRR